MGRFLAVFFMLEVDRAWNIDSFEIKYVNKTDKISFSFSFDLACQNKVLKDPGHVYIGKTIIFSHFCSILADFASIKWSFFSFCHFFLAKTYRGTPGNPPEHAQIIPRSSPEPPKIDPKTAENRPMSTFVPFMHLSWVLWKLDLTS